MKYLPLLFTAVAAFQGCSTGRDDGFEVTFWKHSHEDSQNLLTAEREQVARFFSGGYKNYGGFLASSKTKNLGIADLDSEGVYTANIYGKEITASNFTAVLDGFIYAKEAGEYVLEGKADDGFVAQLGSPNNCDGWYDEYINKTYTLAQYFYTESGVSTKVALEACTWYPIKIIVSNYDGATNFRFSVTSPDGKTLSDDFSNYDKCPQSSVFSSTVTQASTITGVLTSIITGVSTSTVTGVSTSTVTGVSTSTVTGVSTSTITELVQKKTTVTETSIPTGSYPYTGYFTPSDCGSVETCTVVYVPPHESTVTVAATETVAIPRTVTVTSLDTSTLTVAQYITPTECATAAVCTVVYVLPSSMLVPVPTGEARLSDPECGDECEYHLHEEEECEDEAHCEISCKEDNENGECVVVECEEGVECEAVQVETETTIECEVECEYDAGTGAALIGSGHGQGAKLEAHGKHHEGGHEDHKNHEGGHGGHENHEGGHGNGGSGKPHENDQGSLHGDGHGKPHGDVQDKPHGNDHGKPHGDGQGKPHGDDKAKPHGDGQDKPHGDGQDKPHGEGHGKPHGDGQDKPKDEGHGSHGEDHKNHGEGHGSHGQEHGGHGQDHGKPHGDGSGSGHGAAHGSGHGPENDSGKVPPKEPAKKPGSPAYEGAASNIRMPYLVLALPVALAFF